MMVLSISRQFAICVKSRKEAILIYSWLSVIGLFIAYRGIPPLILILKIFLAMSGTALGVYFYNDICDLDDDIVSGELGNLAPSSRPLGKGMISNRRMMVFSAIVSAFGLLFAALINLQVLLLQIAFLIMGLFYSTEPIRLKKRFLFKQITIALGGVIACLSAGMAVGSISGYLIYLTIIYVVIVFGINPLVDLRDMSGDRATGIMTIPVVWGPEFTIKLALATFVAMIISFIVGFYRIGFNLALPLLGTTIITAWAYVVYPLLGRWMDYEFTEKVVYRKGIILYFFLQICILIGSLPI